MEKFNDALLAKLSWRILTNPSSLLVRILTGKYYKLKPFLECTVPKSASHGWHELLIRRDLWKINLGKVIGYGEYTYIWGEPWIYLTKPLTPMDPPTENTTSWKVSNLLLPNQRSGMSRW